LKKPEQVNFKVNQQNRTFPEKW